MGFGALSVKGRALRNQAQREHSRVELERKLARHVQDTEAASAQVQIANALDQLASAGLLSETRAAESVLLHQGRRFGSRRLKQVLLSKGIEAGLVAETLHQARGTELERAREIWGRRFGTAPADSKEQAKQMRFLAGRGFDGEVIRRVVQGREDD